MPIAAMAPAETEAKMVVATSRGDCQKLKDLVNQQDATTMLVVMALSKDASPENSPASMHPLLAAAACRGNWEELNFLLNREGPEPQSSENLGEEFCSQAAAYSICTSRTSVMQQAAADLEVGIHAVPFLRGVTMEGDTALHLVAANGDGDNFIKCADLIHGKDPGLLAKDNNKGDTPLHCAARAGRTIMVSYLIDLARDRHTLNQLLRKENIKKETALHEAVHIGDSQLVKKLLEADPYLACFPKEGTSPLYLAISLKRDIIAEALLQSIKSYLGPNGQNALHAAVLRGRELTEKVLLWNTNKSLTTHRDENGSTPLHFAAGLFWALWKGSVCSQVFKANPAALYQPDNDGLSPIHVAAAAGRYGTINKFVKKCPSSAGLRDSKGRTFLHVAVEKRNVRVVSYACRNLSLAWILNMQDNDGNTAMHLAVQAGSIRMFCPLFGNRQIHLNLTNGEGKTPLDIAKYKVPPGLFYNENSEVRIRYALTVAGAGSGASRWDHFNENYKDIHGQKSDYETKELENMKDLTQTRSIASVLISTVAFGATFALPGGYRADDHTDGGTPTFAARYAFHAFMMANTLAFLFSSAATLCLVRAGSPTFNRQSRKLYSGISFYFMETSVTCLIAAFALGVFVVLSPVARNTAVAICVMSPLVVLCNKAELWLKWVLLLPPFCVRMGLLWTIYRYTRLAVFNILGEFWPFLLIFIWAAYGRKPSNFKSETTGTTSSSVT